MHPFGILSGNAERRKTARYGLELELNYSLLSQDTVVASGKGTTVNLSSRGVLFRPEGPASVGCAVRLLIMWPVALGDGTLLQLFIDGLVLRTDPTRTAVRMLRYQFRTRAMSSRSRV